MVVRCSVISAVIDRISRALILCRLASWRHSRVEFHLPDGTTATVGDLAAGTVDTANVHDDRVFRRLLLGGSTGAGEAYVDGQWSSPDLQGLVSRMLQARDRMTLDAYLSWPRRLLDYVRHTFRPNSRQGVLKISMRTMTWETSSSRSFSMSRWPIPVPFGMPLMI